MKIFAAIVAVSTALMMAGAAGAHPHYHYWGHQHWRDHHWGHDRWGHDRWAHHHWDHRHRR